MQDSTLQNEPGQNSIRGVCPRARSRRGSSGSDDEMLCPPAANTGAPGEVVPLLINHFGCHLPVHFGTEAGVRITVDEIGEDGIATFSDGSMGSLFYEGDDVAGAQVLGTDGPAFLYSFPPNITTN